MNRFHWAKFGPVWHCVYVADLGEQRQGCRLRRKVNKNTFYPTPDNGMSVLNMRTCPKCTLIFNTEVLQS